MFSLSLLSVCVLLQAGQTALDQAREHNNPDVALLLTKAPQVKPVTPSLTITGSRKQNSYLEIHFCARILLNGSVLLIPRLLFIT